MSVAEAIRAWRDEDYAMSLADEARASLPENPAGDVRLHLGFVDPSREEGFSAFTFKQCFSIVLECSHSNCG